MSNSPVKQSDALRQQLAKMSSELEALDQSLLTMQARFDELRSRLPQSSGWPKTDVQIEFSELGVRISEAESRRDHLSKHELPVLEKRLNFTVEGEGAEREIRAASAERTAALDELSAHEVRYGHVLAKIAEIEGEIEVSIARAVEDEQSAAAAYARTVVEGSDEAQQAADTQFRDVQEAVNVMQQQAARKRVVLDALQDEAVNLGSIKADAAGRVAAAEDKLSRALEMKHAVEWDATVEQLARIGARLGAARRMRGESLRAVLSGLNVNRMMPLVSALCIDDVSRLIDGGANPAAD